jgi:hypothetical protein
MSSKQNMTDKTIYNLITKGFAKKSSDDLSQQPEWYSEIEATLQDLANGGIDSIECVRRLRCLGYSVGDIARDIMGDVEQARREAITKRDVLMEGELS